MNRKQERKMPKKGKLSKSTVILTTFLAFLFISALTFVAVIKLAGSNKSNAMVTPPRAARVTNRGLIHEIESSPMDDEDKGAETLLTEDPDGSPIDIYFVNTNRSECIICTDGTYTIMLDSGNSPSGDPESIEAIRALLEEKSITRIDALVLSHGHGDHTGGAQAFLNDLIGTPDTAVSFPRVICDFGNPNVASASNVENLLAELIENRGMDMEFIRPETGWSLELGNMELVCMLQNEGEPVETSDENENMGMVDNQSLIMKVKRRGSDESLLFTGDAPAELEQKLLDKEIDIKCSLLAISHHGMADSSIQDFLTGTGASYGVACTEGWDLDPDLEERCTTANMQLLLTADGTKHFIMGISGTTYIPEEEVRDTSDEAKPANDTSDEAEPANDISDEAEPANDTSDEAEPANDTSDEAKPANDTSKVIAPALRIE